MVVLDQVVCGTVRAAGLFFCCCSFGLYSCYFPCLPAPQGSQTLAMCLRVLLGSISPCFLPLGYVQAEGRGAPESAGSCVDVEAYTPLGM